MSSNQYYQSQTSFYSYSSSSNREESREAYFINIRDDPLSFIPSLQNMPLSSQPTYTAATLNTYDFVDDNNRQDLIKKILGFIFCVVVTFFYQVYERDGYQITPLPIQEFIFFLLVALCASLASMITSQQEQIKALFQRIAIVAIALALASLASMFLQVWFQAAAYGVCMVPLYASAQTRFNHWFLKLWRRLMKKKREYSTSPTEGEQVASYGSYSV